MARPFVWYITQLCGMSVSGIIFKMAVNCAGKRKGKVQKPHKAKVSLTKLSNKRLNKLAKQGKLKKTLSKKKLVRLLKERTLPRNSIDPTAGPDVEVEKDIPLQEADYDYYAKPGRDFKFLAEISEEGDSKKKKKRKRAKDEGYESLEGQYEKRLKYKLPDRQFKELLPFKSKEKGLISRSIEIHNEAEEEENKTEQDDVAEQTDVQEEQPPLTAVEEFVEYRLKLDEAKQRIALFSMSIIESVEDNIGKLQDLRSFLGDAVPVSIRKLAMISLMEVFKDIIPGYRVRLATDVEKQQSMKKETKQLVTYEESLIINYRYYLESLEAIAKGKSEEKVKQNKRSSKHKTPVVAPPPPLSLKNKQVLRQIAVQCLCQLLITHPHFNYRTNIISVIIPFMLHHDSKTSDLVCNAVKRIFVEDKSGDVTLEIVRLIGRVIKAKNFEVKSKVLDTFLALKIKEINKGDAEEGKPRKISRNDKFQSTSRKDRKRQKELKHLEKELQDAAVEDDQKEKKKLHTEIISMVFLTYFRILKLAQRSSLLSSVLEGLAKFAHLINVSYFDDLFAVMTDLVDSGDLTQRQSLHCIQTALVLLMGQGAALNIDPMKFYTHLYKSLLQFHVGKTSEDLPVALTCLDILINKRRRHVSEQRMLAFLKRLCTVSIQLRANGALALLNIVRNIIINFPKADILFEAEGEGSGIYLPELDEPECCNAQNTSVFELHLLRSSYDPTVRLYADYVISSTLGKGQPPQSVARKTPTELFESFDFNVTSMKQVSIPASFMKKSTKKSKKFWKRKQ